MQLYTQGYAPYIVLTGVGNAGQRLDERRERVLVDCGVKAGDIYLVPDSGNTHEEAGKTVALMKKLGWRHVVVVSDPPHLRRVQWAWDRAVKDTGMWYTLVASSRCGGMRIGGGRTEQRGDLSLASLRSFACYAVTLQ